MSQEELYDGREQTLIKHVILRKYLERFAHIVGSYWDVLNYVDCFSGPWEVRSKSFEDASFGIALNELRRARTTLAARGRQVQLRCFFLEKDPVAFARLAAFKNSVEDAEIETRNAALEDSIQEIEQFVRRGGPKAFSFVFIDPTGWKGFGMTTITPLLQIKPGEVLINFMTGHIRRFLVSPDEETQASFQQLFGSADFRERVQGLKREDRDDAAVQEYARKVKEAGGFSQTCTAIVLHPTNDATHYHLIYATRHPKGIEVFKDVEKKAMAVQEAARGKADRDRRERRTGQLHLLDSRDLRDSTHYNALRERYLDKSKRKILDALETTGRLLYDDAWMLTLVEPMTWESDLKDWIRELQETGHLVVEGMRPRQRVPQRNANNCLVWRSQ